MLGRGREDNKPGKSGSRKGDTTPMPQRSDAQWGVKGFGEKEGWRSCWPS